LPSTPPSCKMVYNEHNVVHDGERSDDDEGIIQIVRESIADGKEEWECSYQDKESLDFPSPRFYQVDSLTLKYSPRTALTASGTVSSFRALRSFSKAVSISSETLSMILSIIALGINRYVNISYHVYLLISNESRTSAKGNGRGQVRRPASLQGARCLRFCLSSDRGGRLNWAIRNSPRSWRRGP
jgi:hypothetical protein